MIVIVRDFSNPSYHRFFDHRGIVLLWQWCPSTRTFITHFTSKENTIITPHARGINLFSEIQEHIHISLQTSNECLHLHQNYPICSATRDLLCFNRWLMYGAVLPLPPGGTIKLHLRGHEEASSKIFFDFVFKMSLLLSVVVVVVGAIWFILLLGSGSQSRLLQITMSYEGTKRFRWFDYLQIQIGLLDIMRYLVL